MSNMLGESARTNIRNGTLLLGIGAVVSVIASVVGGNLYFFGGAALWGALFLYRGLRQRRIRAELLRQKTGTNASQSQ